MNILSGYRSHSGFRDAFSRTFDPPLSPESNEHLEVLRRELAAYFAGASRSFSVPLDYPGTPFQRQVWEQLLALERSGGRESASL